MAKGRKNNLDARLKAFENMGKVSAGRKTNGIDTSKGFHKPGSCKK